MSDMLTAAFLLLPIAINLRFERIGARAKVVGRVRRSLRRQSVLRQRKHLRYLSVSVPPLMTIPTAAKQLEFLYQTDICGVIRTYDVPGIT